MAAPYPASLSLRDARALYFERNGIPADGGYAKRWVKATRNRLPLYFLNTAPRRRAVTYHDLHHVLTAYDTSNTGEAEISAWELAAGTRPHWIALFLDLAKRAGLSGIQEWLSFYFKAPMHAKDLYPEHDLFIQLMKLKNTLRHMMGEELITHLGREYYD